jgi:hypothetical protein
MLGSCPKRRLSHTSTAELDRSTATTPGLPIVETVSDDFPLLAGDAT